MLDTLNPVPPLPVNRAAPLKVALLTPVASPGETTDSGLIAEQAHALIHALQSLPDTHVHVVPISFGRQPTAHYVEQALLLNHPEIDVVHIQHDHRFWGGIRPRQSAFWHMRYLIKKPVVLTAHNTASLEELLNETAHTSPVPAALRRISDRMLLRDEAHRDSIEIAPFSAAITIARTAAARNALIARGAKPGYVYIVPTGLPEVPACEASGHAFRERYGLHSGQIITHLASTTRDAALMSPRAPWGHLPAAVKSQIDFVVAETRSAGSVRAYWKNWLQDSPARSPSGQGFPAFHDLSLTECAELLAVTDALFVLSDTETDRQNVLLALAHGCPVLAPDVDEYREIAARVDCLELFQEHAFGAKLTALLADDARRAKLAQNARKYAARFAWPRVAAMTRKVYQAAIDVYSSGPNHLEMFGDPNAVIQTQG